MIEAGDTADHARAMYDDSVTWVLLVAVAVAAVVAIVLAVVFARRIARPIERLAVAAAQIAEGDLAARVPEEGPLELRSLAVAHNTMAERLAEQEAIRREFVVNASHELRTPLTNLQGYLEALRDGVIPPDPATFDSLREEVDRLNRLARRSASSPVRIASRRWRAGRARRPRVDLRRPLGPALARRSIELAVATSPDLVVRGRADDLTQVLANLLQNAVRYTPAGGRVRISAERTGEGIVVRVANTGQAFRPSDLPLVCERFYRVEKSRDRTRGGAGVGLAIVKQLVEQAGGRVGASSDAGWTTFWFRLPA